MSASAIPSMSIPSVPPADVQTRQDALAEKGEEVEEYYPTEYTVKLTVGSSRSAEFARLMLDEILSCYFASFGEKYVDYSTIPNNAENVLAVMITLSRRKFSAIPWMRLSRS